MDRVDYIKLFAKPDDYIPPTNDELPSNTQYPNLNAHHYRNAPVKLPFVHNFYEAFAIKNDEVVLAANNIRGRIWNGCVKGFQDINHMEQKQKPCYEVQCASPVTNLMYVKNSLFLISLSNGTVQLWSPKSEVRSDVGYCLFMIGSCAEHKGVILSMDMLLGHTNAVTGSNDCCLKIWDLGADLSSICTFNYAHYDSITGISASPESSQIFVSCSQDKSALIWDYRQVRPASSLIENNPYSFSTIHWMNSLEKSNNIILGDDSGRIHCVDMKMPNKILYSKKIFNRPIRKVQFNGEHLVVIGNINSVKAFKLEDSEDNLKLVYKDATATDLIRDVQWDKLSEREFYTISWDSKLYKHKIPA